MKESDIQTRLIKYLKVNPLPHTAAIELKLCKKKSLPFSAVAPHQLEGLRKVSNDHMTHKIMDMPHFAGSRIRFDKPKPFDCIFMRNIHSYVGICYYMPRTQMDLALMDINVFILEVMRSKRKSITEPRAKEIAEKIIDLKSWK
jgi:penicillin-binding protein-related factor A (putative recombinase)